MNSKKPRNAKDRILDCAEELVVEIGAGNLTLDAIAERAQISKGGLLYNFPTKESLLKAIVSRLIERFDKLHEQVRNQIPEGPGRDLKAYVHARLEMSGAMNQFQINQNVCASLLAVFANDPKLVAPIREVFKKRLDTIEKSTSSFEKAAIIAFAAEGLAFLELIQFSPLDKKKRKRFVKALMDWIEEE
ncbi:MAG: TetR/AcrR family transcriptional regulator [Candidatus Omnitrophota bacterium]